MIQKVFELFCYNAEGLVAQLKLLLELSGDQDLADQIQLKTIAPICFPAELNRPEVVALHTLLKTVREEEGYLVYHKGVPGDQNRELLSLRFNGETRLLDHEPGQGAVTHKSRAEVDVVGL